MIALGYQQNNAAVIADSIVNLDQRFALVKRAVRRVPWGVVVQPDQDMAHVPASL